MRLRGLAFLPDPEGGCRIMRTKGDIGVSPMGLAAHCKFKKPAGTDLEIGATWRSSHFSTDPEGVQYRSQGSKTPGKRQHEFAPRRRCQKGPLPCLHRFDVEASALVAEPQRRSRGRESRSPLALSRGQPRQVAQVQTTPPVRNTPNRIATKPDAGTIIPRLPFGHVVGGPQGRTHPRLQPRGAGTTTLPPRIPPKPR
jgi:hypothetical protein